MSFLRDHFGAVHFIVALFGVAHFVAGPFMSGLFGANFMKIIFSDFLIYKNFFSTYFFIFIFQKQSKILFHFF